MFASMKLGRLPHDPAVIARMPRLDAHELLIAGDDIARLDREHFHFQPAMDDNNMLGDCTCVGYANGARGAAALHGYEIDITTQQVLGLYSKSCGYVPGQPETDQGGVLADVLAWQARHGFDATNQMLVGDFATVDPANLRAVRAVTNATGMLYCGVELAVADQNPLNGVWDTDTPGNAGDPTPGSWGGHCLGLWDWTGTEDTDTVRLATWGTLQPATWRWVRSRMVECHALTWRDIGGAIDGIDYDKLKADIATFLG